LLFIYAGIFVGNGDDDVMALPSPIVIVFEVCLLLYFIIITFFLQLLKVLLVCKMIDGLL